jgi:hypothetical protein
MATGSPMRHERVPVAEEWVAGVYCGPGVTVGLRARASGSVMCRGEGRRAH